LLMLFSAKRVMERSNVMTTPKVCMNCGKKATVCKKCGKEIGGQYSEVEKNREIVVVDEGTQQATILNKDDCLCPACSRVVTYYRRVR